MRNSTATHIPNYPEHGGTEFDAGFYECEAVKVVPLYTAIENAIIDLRDEKSNLDIITDLKKALKVADQ